MPWGCTILFDFDTPIDRRNTASLKWEKYHDRDIIPMWVADMDFHSPPAVIHAIHRRVEHGVFGYTLTPIELIEEILSLLRKEYEWEIEPDWIIWLPGLVTGINICCRTVGETDDHVMTTVPAYPPFLSAPGNSRRNLITVPFTEENGRWGIDFDQLEKAITPKTRLFVLCNPHNPTGRVFSRQEITTLADICQRNDIIICSDEIHCQMILDKGNRHIPTATLDPAIAEKTITLMSPSKTYNLPGLGCSFAVISNSVLRRRFQKEMAGIVPHVNTLGYVAALAAYRDGSSWLSALLEYLRGNRDLVENEVGQMPAFSMNHVEATYLAWIDTRPAGIDNPVAFFEAAGVGLSDGAHFDCPRFVRLNFGCPRVTLIEALKRIKSALK